VAVVARDTGLRRGRARHHVPPGMPRFGAHGRAVLALGEALERVLHVARGAARAAIVAVEANPASQGASLRPEMALQALLPCEIGEVRAELVGRKSLLERREWHELRDLAT